MGNKILTSKDKKIDKNLISSNILCLTKILEGIKIFRDIIR